MRSSNIYKERGINVEKKREAERRLFFLIQQERYHVEIKQILKTGHHKNTKIAALNPFIDKYGLLRVGGRLRNAQISEEHKYPILLP